MNQSFSVQLEASGHLVDSGFLSEAMDDIVRAGGAFRVVDFRLGADNSSPSQVILQVTAADPQTGERIVRRLGPLGFYPSDLLQVRWAKAPRDGAAPEGFYSSTNNRTEVYRDGRWTTVRDQRMDAAIVDHPRGPLCVKLRDLKRGDRIAMGHDGIRVLPEPKERDRSDFAFMTNEVSSEKKVEWVVGRVAEWITNRSGKLIVVAGPVVIHTGGSEPLADIVKRGHVDAVLAGNALAVHDVERALHGTSLGIDTTTGVPVEHGHQNHMRAINTIRLAGGLRAAVKKNVLKTGLMRELIVNRVPFVLAGSIRDDGPLPEVITDVSSAQEAYAKHLKGADVVLMLASMLHAIAVGNMLPAWVKTVCVDINAQVVTKLNDRGSHQAIGCVTDVGLFLHLLAERLG